MAAEKHLANRNATLISEETDEISKKNSDIRSSQRKRFQNDDNDPSELQCLIAEQLSDYLDRNIKDVAIIDNQDDITVRVAEQADDFQLFSTQHRTCYSVDSSTSKHTQRLKDSKNKENIIDSSSSDDSEMNAQLKEAAVSAEDILSGSALNMVCL